MEHAAKLATRAGADVYDVSDVARLHVLTLDKTLQLVALIALDHSLFGFTPAMLLKALQFAQVHVAHLTR